MSEQNFTGNSLNGKFSILKVIKYIIISYIISFILVLALSALIVYTDVSEAVGNTGVEVITYLGSFICAFLLGRSTKKAGLLGGGVIGMISLLGLILIGIAVYGEIADAGNIIIKILGGFLSGALGGVLGVNTGKE